MVQRRWRDVYEAGRRLARVPGVVACIDVSDGLRADLAHLLARRIHEPLGIPPEAWQLSYGRYEELDGMRLYTLASGAAYAPRALARISELMLGRGSVGGRRILSSETVATLLSDAQVPARRLEGHPIPALGWWLNEDGFFRSLPRDAVFTGGANHQILLVVPSLDLVMVRLGAWLDRDGIGDNFWDGVEELLFAPLMEAVGS